MMDNGLLEQVKVNNTLLKISKDLDIPLVATNDIHYLEQGEAFAHEALLSIQTQTTVSDPNRFKFNSDTFYFRSAEEMKEVTKGELILFAEFDDFSLSSSFPVYYFVHGYNSYR